MASPMAEETLEPTIVGPYVLDRILGSGSYGKVRLAKHSETGALVAVKIIEKPNMRSDQLERVQMEHTAMRELKHHNIVRLFDVIEDSLRINIVMSFGQCGDLLEYIKTHKRLSEEEAHKIFRQLVSAVEFAHKNHFIHRDLKAENIFLGEDLQVILGDWGFASRWNPGVMLSASYGSLHYAAPEICEGREYSGPEVDVWSVGVILFAMVAGSLPFTGKDEWSIYQRLIAADFKVPAHVSADCTQLIKIILVPDRFRRATMFDIRRSQWFCRSFAPAGTDAVAAQTGSTGATANTTTGAANAQSTRPTGTSGAASARAASTTASTASPTPAVAVPSPTTRGHSATMMTSSGGASAPATDSSMLRAAAAAAAAEARAEREASTAAAATAAAGGAEPPMVVDSEGVPIRDVDGDDDVAPLSRKLSRFTFATGKKEFSISSLFGRLNPREKKRREEEDAKKRVQEAKEEVRRPRSNSYSPTGAGPRSRQPRPAPGDMEAMAAAARDPNGSAPTLAGHPSPALSPTRPKNRHIQRVLDNE